MPTVLEALTSPNVDIDSSGVPGGSNTITDTEIEAPQGWIRWEDFDYKTLVRIFASELNREYHGPPERWPLPRELSVKDERTLENLLHKFTTITVNYALADQDGAPYLGEGTQAGSNADWSATSPHCVGKDGILVDFLPGDTKVDAKWWPDMVNDERTLDEWQKVMTQVISYMALERSRYGFIITDAGLTALRITRVPTHPGLAQGRPAREKGPSVAVATYGGHQRQISDVTMASGSDSASGSLFVDNDPTNWEYYPPEYCVVPWRNKGKKLTNLRSSAWC